MNQVVIYIKFPHQGPFGDEMTMQLEDLAKSIITEPGFLWKIWTEDHAEKLAGGIYLFESRETAENYLAKHTERLQTWGYTDIEIKIFNINETLSLIDKAPIGSSLKN
ncbi:monooxygenase [Chryseobacterium sp. L7]|uniref:Monooxygenase n=1 Tax=Chryseobacterium endalhagicum TaxID=2797638 RepID=A0ABS1QGD3_9FLAO|nr:monooxygenase [Chryseobacterium endalhagicum]MBL1220978.1 monooxygenase [Chryseobacterium endalhagicum]